MGGGDHKFQSTSTSGLCIVAAPFLLGPSWLFAMRSCLACHTHPHGDLETTHDIVLDMCEVIHERWAVPVVPAAIFLIFRESATRKKVKIGTFAVLQW